MNWWRKSEILFEKMGEQIVIHPKKIFYLSYSLFRIYLILPLILLRKGSYIKMIQP